MQWIKYHVFQNTVDSENIFLQKKISYSEANLLIAKREAYNGEYEIVEDEKDYQEKPVPIEFGGTNAKTAEEARTNLNAEQARLIITETKAIVNITVEDYADYSFIDVVNLTMKGALVNAHGFITFGASVPSIKIEGFTALSGDDITMAAVNETWEFSVYSHNNKNFIIWKNWGA